MHDVPDVQKGDPILAEDFRALIRLAEERELSFIPHKVTVYNASGADVGLGGILGIDGPMAQYLPSVSVPRFTQPKEVYLQGVSPTVASHLGKWVVPLQPITAGHDGECKADGVARVRVYVNGADDAYCDVIAAETVGGDTVYLGTGASGAQILYRQNEGSGAGTIVWAIVRLGTERQPNALMIRGLTTAEVAESDETFVIDNIVIMQPTGGLIVDQTPPVDPGDTMTIYNVQQLYLSADDTEVVAEWNESTGHWEWRLEILAPGLLFFNNSGEAAPPHAVMGVSDAGQMTSEEPYVDIVKPSATYRKQYVVNASSEIANAAYGRSRDVGHYIVAYDQTTGTPAAGDIWVPKAGQWTLVKSQTSYSTGPIGWHVVVAGIYDGAAHYLVGKIVDAPPLMPYILYDDMAPGDSDKAAYPVKSDLTADTVADKNVLVSDGILKTTRAKGSNFYSDTTKGARVWTMIGPDGKNHIVAVNGMAQRCSAILAAAGAPGASVNVDNVVPLDGGQSPVTSSSSTISATMPPAARALDNAVCVIEWDENGDAWKITQVHEQARSIRGTLSSAMAEGDATETITSPVSCDGGQVPTGTVTGYNVFSWAGDSGGECWALWNEATDHYEFVNVECPA